MAITSVQQIATAALTGQHLAYWKQWTSTVGEYCDLWSVPNFYPGGGVTPPSYLAGSGYTCDSTTAGAMPYVNASVQNYLVRATVRGSGPATPASGNTFTLYDRLWHCAGMGFAAATYTVATPGDLPARITDAGAGCELWLICDPASNTGAGSGTITAAYLNPAGAAKTATFAVSELIGGIMRAQNCYRMTLQAGDSGIKQLTSVTNDTTFVSGTWGAMIIKPIATLPILPSNQPATYRWGKLMERIPNNACLFGIAKATSNGTNVSSFQAVVVDL